MEKANFLLTLLIVYWFSWSLISIVDSNDQIRYQTNDTNQNDTTFKQCLRVLQRTNFSLDGLTNCTCADGYEFDEVFGVCFQNKCEQICGDMNCSILKHGRYDYEYHCYCAAGFERLDFYHPSGCIPIEQKYSKFIDEQNEVERVLNPFLMNYLGCDQMYQMNAAKTDYECICLKGYKLDPATNKCKKIGQYNDKLCNANQIATLDEYDQVVCKCKTGFTGADCKLNICQMKGRTNEESIYINRSINEFCGTSSCDLVFFDEKKFKFNEFKCECPQPLTMRGEDGKCKLVEDCSEEQRFEKCSNEKMCKIRTDSDEAAYDCRCPIEMSESNNSKLDQHLEKCKEIEKKEHCLDGYLPNPDVDNEHKQKCIKSVSNFKIAFKLRFEPTKNNSDILFNNYYNLVKGIDLDKIPTFLRNDFIDYKDKALVHSMDKMLDKQLIKTNMGKILENGFNRTLFAPHSIHFKECVMKINELEFDYNTFRLLRIEESLVSVDLSISCRTYATGDLFVRFFNFYLKHNYFDSKYRNFENVGYIIPESIRHY